MTKNRIAPTMNQLRNDCAQTLRLANPIAPRKPKGRQQANVESAAITAVTGVARSATFILRLYSVSASSSFASLEPHYHFVANDCDRSCHKTHLL